MKNSASIGYYKEIFETVPDALMVVGPNGTILLVNAAMEHLSGYPKEELVGASCTILDCDACESYSVRNRRKMVYDL